MSEIDGQPRYNPEGGGVVALKDVSFGREAMLFIRGGKRRLRVAVGKGYGQGRTNVAVRILDTHEESSAGNNRRVRVIPGEDSGVVVLSGRTAARLVSWVPAIRRP